MPDNLNYNAGAVITYFARLDVAPTGTSRVLSQIKTPGVDGVGLREEELTADPFEGRSIVYVGSFADGDAVRVIYEALRGKLLTINHKGMSSANVAVLDVKVAQQRPCYAHFVILPDGTVDSGLAAAVEANWIFQYAGPP